MCAEDTGSSMYIGQGVNSFLWLKKTEKEKHILEVERDQLKRNSPRSGASRALTILLDLLIEVVDINSVVGAGLGNCHGERYQGTA